MKKIIYEKVIASIVCCVVVICAACQLGQDDSERRRDAARWQATDEVLRRGLSTVRAVLDDPISLQDVDPSFRPEEVLLHPQYGVTADYAAWRDYRVEYEASVDLLHMLKRLGMEQLTGQDPVNAPVVLDQWAREVESADSPYGLISAALEAADISTPEPVALGEHLSAVDLLDSAALEAHTVLEREALGALGENDRALLPFVVRYLMTTGGTYRPSSLEAPPRPYRVHRSHMSFAPGDQVTPLGLTVPEMLPTVTSIYHFYRSLAGMDKNTGGISFEEKQWYQDTEWTGHVAFARRRVDLAATARAFATIAPILEAPFLEELEQQVRGSSSRSNVREIPGVDGDVLLYRETAYGDLLIGGPGPNNYTDTQASVIVDVGGNDTYDTEYDLNRLGRYPLRVVIDLRGDDVYAHREAVGPGAGVFGLGILLDQEGNDVYTQGMTSERGHERDQLRIVEPASIGKPGPEIRRVDPALVYGGEKPASLDGGFSYGASLFGIGLHIDRAGDDTYLVDKWALGAAHGPGVGVLTDQSGDDWYVAAVYSIGVGFNKGVGILRDLGNGEDLYQCWGVYKNSYSSPGRRDAGFEGYGIGVGSGWRSENYTGTSQGDAAGFVGGIGLVNDGGGDDTYVSSTFGLGIGFTAGIGMLIESDGDDVYLAMKGEDGAQNTGMGGGIHHGTALVLDRSGDDFYSGAALAGGGWDLGVGFFIDVAGSDAYTDLMEVGLWPARSEVQSFGVFLDGGGEDTFSEWAVDWANAEYLRLQPEVHRGIGGNFSVVLLLGPETDWLPPALQDTLRSGVTLTPVHHTEEADGVQYPRGIGVIIIEALAGGTR